MNRRKRFKRSKKIIRNVKTPCGTVEVFRWVKRVVSVCESKVQLHSKRLRESQFDGRGTENATKCSMRHEVLTLIIKPGVLESPF